MQTRFRQNVIPEQKKQVFEKLVHDILQSLREEVQNDVSIDELILRHKQLERIDTKLRRKPEDVTKELIIEPILKFLGYKKLGRSSGSISTIERREADYTLEVHNERILIEAEPLNKDLFNVKGQGVEQVKSYLEKRSFRADLGIATNGFEWVLIKYDTKSYNFKQIDHTDLRSFFSVLRGQQNLVDATETLQKFFLNFAFEYILTASEEYARILEESKESITARFYEDYIRYVFGYDKRTGQQVKCLLTALKVPPNTEERSKRLFVITLMSRLIFIKFLEDKKLVRPGFLRTLLVSYRTSKIPSSFYRTYLQPLFYDVFNTPPNTRRPHILAISEFTGIPYLNGGLFREVVKDELQYDVDDDILEIIMEMLGKYLFTLEDNPNALNPDILGLVFEKTINYLTGEGTDRRKDLGAYYTPDDVTTYISKETIRNRTLAMIKDYLKDIGWKDTDIDQYESLEDFLDNIPLNPKTLKGIYERIREITVLDPACGSGHFLTSAMKELFHIRKILVASINMNMSNYEIKKDIITSNLFGVDIENSAVEIARLRLWLSLIEDLDVSSNGKDIETLPNIEYNIEEGNSLLGFTTPPTMEQMRLDDDITIRKVFREIDDLKQSFRMNPDPMKASEIKRAIDQKINVYNIALNRKLAANLASRHKLKFSSDEISAMNPFHWRLKFSDIFSRKEGFDVIIGNPPYVERSKLDYPTALFDTDECGNTYAYFFEIGLQILTAGGYIGLIVPISSICTDRMIPLQEMLKSNCSLLRTSNFDDRPSKIFEGLEHCRSSIIIGRKKDKGEMRPKIYSTKYNRWYSHERSKLFNNLQFVDCTKTVVPGIIPKISTKIELDLLLRLRKEPPLSTYLVNEGSKSKIIWYHNAPQYWIRAMNFIPTFEGKSADISSHVKKLYANDSKKRDQIISVLNSSLFYWFFVISSNCRDLTQREISNFNIDLDNMSSSNGALLMKYCAELMEDLKKHSIIKKTTYKKTGTVIYQEFYPKHSKPIIDKIDDVLANHYGLTEEQKQFVKTFDERFRMGEPD